jgi:GNAT superfamily N-acetyltransferase
MEFTIRPATVSDLQGIHDCWLETDYPDAAQRTAYAALGMAPWFPHLLTTGTLWIAVAGERIIGFAGTQTRGNVCYLSDCYTHPTWQSRGVNAALLAALFDDSTHVRCTLASSDPRALSRYVRAGMTPLFPSYMLRSTARTRSQRPVFETRACLDREEWLAHDTRFLGHDRRVDIDYFASEAACTLLQIFDGSQLVGQAVTNLRRYDLAPNGKRNLGPVASIDRVSAAAVVQSALGWLMADGATEVSMRLPGPHPALPILLAAGMQVAYAETYCASAEWFDPQCYAPSGLM